MVLLVNGQQLLPQALRALLDRLLLLSVHKAEFCMKPHLHDLSL